MNAPALRPLGVGEILDVGIKISFRNAWTLFRIVLFVVLPTQILVNVIQVSALPKGVHSSYTFEPTPSFTSDRTSLSGRETATLITGFVFALLLNALAGKLAEAASFRAVTDACLGEGSGWRQSLRFALRRLPAVAVVKILSTIFIARGTLACRHAVGGDEIDEAGRACDDDARELEPELAACLRPKVGGAVVSESPEIFLERLAAEKAGRGA